MKDGSLLAGMSSEQDGNPRVIKNEKQDEF